MGSSQVLCAAPLNLAPQNLLFRRRLNGMMSLPLLHRDSRIWIISDEYDFTALLAALMSVFLLCCNLRVSHFDILQ